MLNVKAINFQLNAKFGGRNVLRDVAWIIKYLFYCVSTFRSNIKEIIKEITQNAGVPEVILDVKS